MKLVQLEFGTLEESWFIKINAYISIFMHSFEVVKFPLRLQSQDQGMHL